MLQSMGSQRVGKDGVTELKTQKLTCLLNSILRIGRDRRTENKVSMHTRGVFC